MVEIAISIISGIISGLGQGGGSILILLLSLFMNIQQQTAQGINLLFFVPTAIIATVINLRQKCIDFKTGIIIGSCGIIGAIIGAKVSINTNSEVLKKYFAIFLLCIAIYEIYDVYQIYRDNKIKKNILGNKSK